MLFYFSEFNIFFCGFAYYLPLFACPKSGVKKTPMCKKTETLTSKPKTDSFASLKQSNVSVFSGFERSIFLTFFYTLD